MSTSDNVGFAEKQLVIGAGPVGLAMAAALKRAGISYDQVDANAGVGGNWHKGVFKNTHIISSKRSTAYADYPMPEHYPDFPHWELVRRYLESYAQDQDIAGHIELGKKVVRAQPAEGWRWDVTFEDGETRRYKGLVVCNGHHWDKRWPKYPGRFTGEMIHSKDFFDPAVLADKRTLVIGGGNSGCDIACEAARFAASSDISLRSGYWFMPKTFLGVPLTELPIGLLPVPVQRLLLKLIIRVTLGRFRDYGLPHPEHKIYERHPVFGTELLAYIRQGRIKPRGDIERFDGRKVVFSDGSAVEYDLIICATGFYNSLPFLPEGMIGVRNNTLQLYGGAFPAHVRNLVVVGSAQLRGGFGPVLTHAVDLYARMIKMQDELTQPIGRILKSLRQPLPDSNLLDPHQTRRKIWRANRLLPILKWQDRRLSRQQRRTEPAGAFTHKPGEVQRKTAA